MKGWSPLKAAIVAFFGVLLVGAAVGFALHSGAGGDSFAAGERVGQALGPVCCAAAIAAYVIQKRR